MSRRVGCLLILTLSGSIAQHGTFDPPKSQGLSQLVASGINQAEYAWKINPSEALAALQGAAPHAADPESRERLSATATDIAIKLDMARAPKEEILPFFQLASELVPMAGQFHNLGIAFQGLAFANLARRELGYFEKATQAFRNSMNRAEPGSDEYFHAALEAGRCSTFSLHVSEAMEFAKIAIKIKPFDDQAQKLYFRACLVSAEFRINWDNAKFLEYSAGPLRRETGPPPPVRRKFGRKLRVASEGNGSHGSYIMKPLVELAFPEYDGVELVGPNDKGPVDLVFKAMFQNFELDVSGPAADAPYIVWSGEDFWCLPRAPNSRGEIVAMIATVVSEKEETGTVPPLALAPHGPESHETDDILIGRGGSGFPIFWAPHTLTIITEYETLSPKRGGHRPFLLAYCATRPVPYRNEAFALFFEKDPTHSTHAVCTVMRELTPDAPEFPIDSTSWRANAKRYSLYRFVFAFENTQKKYRGYVTEKLAIAFLSGAIPLYYGDCTTARLIYNPDAFICMEEFPTLAEAVDYVLHIDANPAEYNRIANQPVFKDDYPPNVVRGSRPDLYPGDSTYLSKMAAIVRAQPGVQHLIKGEPVPTYRPPVPREAAEEYDRSLQRERVQAKTHPTQTTHPVHEDPPQSAHVHHVVHDDVDVDSDVSPINPPLPPTTSTPPPTPPLSEPAYLDADHDVSTAAPLRPDAHATRPALHGDVGDEWEADGWEDDEAMARSKGWHSEVDTEEGEGEEGRVVRCEQDKMELVGKVERLSELLKVERQRLTRELAEVKEESEAKERVHARNYHAWTQAWQLVIVLNVVFIACVALIVKRNAAHKSKRS